MSTEEEIYQSPFDRRAQELDISESEATRWERHVYRFDRWVRAPMLVIWDDWRTRIGLSIIVLYLFMGTVGVVVLQAPSANQGPTLVPWFQNWAHPLGTDQQGRWMLSLIVHATPPMLKMIASGAIFASVMATGIGILAGFKRGRIDRILMTSADIMLAVPGFVLAIVLASIIQPENPFVVGLILTVNAWGGTARQIRSEVLSVREESYVEAAYLLGASTPSIVVKDILPNVMPFVLVKFVQQARTVIYSSVALYYLGVLPFSNFNWGVVLNQAVANAAMLSFSTANWVMLPMIAIVILALGLIFLAQGMDRLFNPRIRARYSKTVESSGPPAQAET